MLIRSVHLVSSPCENLELKFQKAGLIIGSRRRRMRIRMAWCVHPVRDLLLFTNRFWTLSLSLDWTIAPVRNCKRSILFRILKNSKFLSERAPVSTRKIRKVLPLSQAHSFISFTLFSFSRFSFTLISLSRFSLTLFSLTLFSLETRRFSLKQLGNFKTKL